MPPIQFRWTLYEIDVALDVATKTGLPSSLVFNLNLDNNFDIDMKNLLLIISNIGIKYNVAPDI